MTSREIGSILLGVSHKATDMEKDSCGDCILLGVLPICRDTHFLFTHKGAFIVTHLIRESPSLLLTSYFNHLLHPSIPPND
jgi:hypothetical protein